ncbi:conjugal transfer protein TraG N-terminal domain-containing protein [[Empedobacter] haloabium]|uniref:Conjugal transfer protein TraG N-terminal domain-containing protein n=1 Tax=[Empedobacter] haloabium TaxID=592317 RepID=A0ABZ1URZ9_9BURK
MWEIYAYQDADALAGVFNAIAAIAGANDFKSALAISAICGFFAAFCAYAFAPHKLAGWQWLASVTLAMSVLFVPRVQVGIIDKTGGDAERVIDNVPLGLAVLASLTSTVGNTVTSLFETAFQAIPGSAGLTAELTYQKNGLMFGNRLIRKASAVVFNDPRFRTDLINFIGSCTMYDLADGTVSPAAFANSGNVWPLMANPNPARFSTITDASGETHVMPCPEVYRTLDRHMPAQVERVHGGLALELNPTLPATVVASVLTGQIEQTYIKARIADAATNAADIVRQNALINAVNDSSLLVGQKINDAPAMMLAVGRAQALAQTNAAWINSGKVAEQGLPIIRNVLEAFVYGLFPVLLLAILLTSGRDTIVALKNYCAVLIFIQLWPVLYAILNYLATIYAAKELAAAADVGGGLKALSLSTSSAIYSNAVSTEAVVGYLTASIPLFAWFAVKRMENFGSALVSGWSTLQATLTANTNAAAVGNTNMGNVSMDQMALAPNRSSPFFSARQNDVTGNVATTNVNSGLTAIKALMNEGPASRQMSVGVTKNEVVDAQRSVTAAKAESLALTREHATAVADVIAHAHSSGNSVMHSDGTVQSQSSTAAERAGELQQIAANVSKQTGASTRQVTEVALGGSLTAGAGAMLGGHGALKAQTGNSATLDQLDQKVRSSLSTQDISKFRDFSQSLSKDSRALSSIFSDTKVAEEHSKRIATTSARAARAEASLRSEQAYSERISSMFARGDNIVVDMAKDPHHSAFFLELLRDQQVPSGAMMRRFESYLGNEALPPTRVSPDSVPNGFDGLTKQHTANKRELHIDAPQKGTVDGKVNSGPHPSVRNGAASRTTVEKQFSDEHDATTEKLAQQRKEMGIQGTNTETEVTRQHLQFDERNGIERDADGQPHAAKGKSLVGKVYKNMENSRDPVSDSVGDTIRAITEKLRPHRDRK